MNKVTKFLAIIFLILQIFSQKNLYSQSDVTNNNFGTEVNAPPAFQGQQMSQDGFSPPRTKKEERTIRKARRIVISDQEYSILARGEKNKDTLTIIEKIRYPFIKRRYKKFKKLQDQYKKIKQDQYTQDTTSATFSEQDTALVLSIKEKEIINKYNQDSASLSPKELKTYKKTQKKIQRHNKKINRKKEKFKNKYAVQEITEEERALKEKAYYHPDSLSKEEKKQLKEIEKKEKHNHKLGEKRTKHKIDSTLAAGGYAPTDQKKFSFKGMFKRQKRQRPSSFVKKMRRINRRYKLSKNEQQAYNKRKSGAFLTPAEKILANRAASKIYIQRQKEKKLLRKEYIKSQPRHTRKMLKKGEREQKRRQKKRLPRRKKHFFKDLFKKRK
jgi:hypothetical protein